MLNKLLSGGADLDEGTDSTAAQPFPADTGEHYFAGDADRVQRLNLLVHLMPYGGVLLLLGEEGVGKTALLRQLSLRASDSCRICQLSASACIDPRQMLEEMLDNFAWQANVDPSLGGAQLGILREHLGILRRNGYAPVLIIDDAEALPDSVFGVLEQLYDGGDCLTLILAGGLDLKKRLAGPLLQSLNTHVTHELELPAFSSSEQTDYIRQHLEWADIEGMGPFQPSALKFIFVASRGVAQRINELARVFWANKKTGADTAVGYARVSSLPWLKQLRYILPLVLISSAAAIFHQEIRTAIFPLSESMQLVKSLDPAPVVAINADAHDLQIGQIRLTETNSEAVSRTLPAVPSTLAQTSPPSEAAVLDAFGLAATSVVSAENLVQLARVSGSGLAASLLVDVPMAVSESSAGAAVVKQVNTGRPQPAASLAIAQRAETESLGLETHPLKADGHQAVVAAATASSLGTERLGTETDAELSRLAEPGVASQALVSEGLADKVASETHALTDNERKGGVPVPSAVTQHGDDWWLKQPAGQYAVQLLAMDETVVKAYIDRHVLADKVGTFWVLSGKQGLLAVASGPFKTQTEANEAALTWRQRLPDTKPWVRSVASIQQAVDAFRRQQRPAWLTLVVNHEQQLLQRQPGGYAVQLVAMDQAGVTRFVEKHGLADQVVYFRTRSGGQELYAALLGSYPSRELALAAGHEIARQAKSVRPWVRSIASVQQTIRNQRDRPR